jgi:hypothetical protein
MTDTTANQYDGKAFLIDYTDPKEPGGGYLWPADGSIPPARIRGWSLSGRWTLDPKNTGKVADYVQGPYCRDEVFEAEGKRGEQTATEAGDIPVWKHADGTPWTAQECEAVPLPDGPIKAGPNASPLNAPTLKQVGDQIVPVNQAPPTTAATPLPTTSTAAPAGSPTTAATAPTPTLEQKAQSLSLVARMRDLLNETRISLDHGAHRALDFLASELHKL